MLGGMGSWVWSITEGVFLPYIPFAERILTPEVEAFRPEWNRVAASRATAAASPEVGGFS